MSDSEKVFVPVEVEGIQTVGIYVQEDTPVINVILMAANRAGVIPHLNHSLLEAFDSLKYGTTIINYSYCV